MKKLILSALLAVLLIPCSFATQVAFDFFTGSGFTLGLLYGENFHWGYGIMLDGHKGKVQYEYEGDKFDGDEEAGTRFGGFYQMDYSFLPIKIQAIKLGFNAGAQVGMVFSSFDEISVSPIDWFLAPFISVQAMWKKLSVTMGWRGCGYLGEAIGTKHSMGNFDDYTASYSNAWTNAFLIGVRYTFKTSSLQRNSGTSNANIFGIGGGSTNTRIIYGSNIWPAE